jgi:hypothetical protein
MCVVTIPRDETRENQLVELAWIGRLSAFAGLTNSRILGLVEDSEIPIYGLLLSFDTPENKAEFLILVRDDGYADPDAFCVPSAEQICQARPVAEVFPAPDAEYILDVSLRTRLEL